MVNSGESDFSQNRPLESDIKISEYRSQDQFNVNTWRFWWRRETQFPSPTQKYSTANFYILTLSSSCAINFCQVSYFTKMWWFFDDRLKSAHHPICSGIATSIKDTKAFSSFDSPSIHPMETMAGFFVPAMSQSCSEIFGMKTWRWRWWWWWRWRRNVGPGMNPNSGFQL